MDYRIKRNSLGEIEVPKDKLWGAQTQRSFQNFKIGKDCILIGKRLFFAL